jgi:hypothetical protein
MKINTSYEIKKNLILTHYIIFMRLDESSLPVLASVPVLTIQCVFQTHCFTLLERPSVKFGATNSCKYNENTI